jgi:hypothetical protein
MRLVQANVVWGVGVVALVLVTLASPLGGILLLPLLALPTAGVFRVAARIVRGEPDVGLHDIAAPYRSRGDTPAMLGLVGAATAATLVLTTNLVSGFGQGGPFGWIIATLAAWGLVALWCGALVAWPLIVDPVRAGTPFRARLRLAGAMLLTDPVRIGALGLVAALISIVSAVLTAAILTVSVSFVALVACRAVYPVADHLDAVMAGERP